MGAQAPRVQYIFFLVILYFIFVIVPPFSPVNLASLTQIATIQPKNLTKIIKIFTMVTVGIRGPRVYIEPWALFEDA